MLSGVQSMRDCGKDASSSGLGSRDSCISTLIQGKKLSHRPGAADPRDASGGKLPCFYRSVELLDRIPLQTGKAAYSLGQAAHPPLYHGGAGHRLEAGHDLDPFISLIFTRAQILCPGLRPGCAGLLEGAYEHFQLYAGSVLLEKMFVPLRGAFEVGRQFSIPGKDGRKPKRQDGDRLKQLAQDLVKLEHGFPPRRSSPDIGSGVAGNKNRQTRVFDTMHGQSSHTGARPVEWRRSFGHAVDEDGHYFLAGSAGGFRWRMAASIEVSITSSPT